MNALDCPLCEATGLIDVQMPWHAGDMEPRIREVTCPQCIGRKQIAVSNVDADLAFIRRHTPAVEVELPY